MNQLNSGYIIIALVDSMPQRLYCRQAFSNQGAILPKPMPTSKLTYLYARGEQAMRCKMKYRNVVMKQLK